MFGKKERLLFALTALVSGVYLIWRIFFTIPFGAGAFAVLFGVLLLLAEGMDILELTVQSYGAARARLPEKPTVAPERFPDVDVLIPTYNEPEDLLYKTVNGCLHMDYPDPGRVHIYLCDDSNRPAVRALARRLGVGYFARAGRTGAKAGNLNHALRQTASPLVVTFDADMIPMRDFLTACVPYLLGEGDNVGFVQTPQSFYNPDLFQYALFSEENVPNEQDYFFRKVQLFRNSTGSAIYAGSNTVISRRALDEAGGFYEKVITEDFATGILMQEKGYRAVALPEVHASGLSPTDLKSLIKQRERWARGCIQTFQKLRVFTNRRLSPMQRLSYFTSLTYWFTGLKRLCYLAAPLLVAVFGVPVLRCTPRDLILLWLPMYLLRHASLVYFFHGLRNERLSNIYETVLALPLLPGVLLESVGVRKRAFSVTRKEKGGESGRLYRLSLAAPYMALGVLSLAGAVNCLFGVLQGRLWAALLLVWLAVNVYTVAMCLFFLLGRPMYRLHERVRVRLGCRISFDGRVIHCHTRDVSEAGLSIYTDFPEYIPPETPVNAEIFDRGVACRLRCRVLRVEEAGGQWVYAMRVTDINEQENRALLQILYDRVPTLPQKLEGKNGALADIGKNIRGRRRPHAAKRRRLARIPLGLPLRAGANAFRLEAFSYEFALIRPGGRPAERLSLPGLHGLSLECVLDAPAGDGLYLYRVQDAPGLAADKRLRETLAHWMKQSVSA